MDPQVSTSFIPKKPVDSGYRSGGISGLFLLLAVFVFIISLVAAGGAFLYQQYLNKEIVDKNASLEAFKKDYDPATIDDLSRLDLRLHQAQTLLAKHTAASGIFAFLSAQTLINVSFTSFGYTLGEDGSASIILQGVADSFSTVALQSDQFGGNKLLKDVVFSNITVGQNGTISFGVAATVVPSVLLYSALFDSGASATDTSASSTPQ